MHANERNSQTRRGATPVASVTPARRRFLRLCTCLFGTLGLARLAAGQPGPGGGGDPLAPAFARGPRERALREADLYRPHNLAG